MDQLMSFCVRDYIDNNSDVFVINTDNDGEGSTINGTDTNSEYVYSGSGGDDDDDETDSIQYGCSNSSKRTQELLLKCEKYRGKLRYQDKQLDSYKKLMEVIEEENSKLNNHLNALERANQRYVTRIANCEETINSLRETLNLERNEGHHNNVEHSKDVLVGTLCDPNLSFSDEDNIKIFQKDDSFSCASDRSKDNEIVCNGRACVNDKSILFDSYQKLFAQVIELKKENEHLRAQIHRLTKDNEDYQTILWYQNNAIGKLTTGCNENNRNQRKNEYINSTPLKVPVNFISYQELNLPEHYSYSIDEDSDVVPMSANVDQMLVTPKQQQQQLPNKKENTNKNLFDKPNNINQFGDVKSTFTTSCDFSIITSDVTSIEHEQIPSCIVARDDTNATVEMQNKFMLDKVKMMHSQQSSAQKQNHQSIFKVNSIEDEKFPHIPDMPIDSSTSDKSQASSNPVEHGGGGVECQDHQDKMKNLENEHLLNTGHNNQLSKNDDDERCHKMTVKEEEEPMSTKQQVQLFRNDNNVAVVDKANQLLLLQHNNDNTSGGEKVNNQNMNHQYVLQPPPPPKSIWCQTIFHSKFGDGVQYSLKLLLSTLGIFSLMMSFLPHYNRRHIGHWAICMTSLIVFLLLFIWKYFYFLLDKSQIDTGQVLLSHFYSLWPSIDIRTKLLPFYSLEEIIYDFMEQSFFV